MSATASLTEDLRLIASTSASRWPAVSSPSCSTSAWKSLASTMVLLAANQLQGTSHYFMSEQSHPSRPDAACVHKFWFSLAADATSASFVTPDDEPPLN